MKFLVAVVAVLCCMQAIDARVARSATQTNALDEVWATLQSIAQNITAGIQAHTPSQDELRQQLQTHASTLATNIQQAASQFNEKASQLSGDAQTALRQASEHLQTKVTELRTQFPDAAQGADKLKTSLDSAVTEFRRVQESLQPHTDAIADSLKSTLRTSTEQITQIANQVQQQVQHAATAH